MTPQPARRFTAPNYPALTTQVSERKAFLPRVPSIPWTVGVAAAGLQSLALTAVTAAQAAPATLEPDSTVMEMPEGSLKASEHSQETFDADDVQTAHTRQSERDEAATFSPFWGEAEAAPATQSLPPSVHARIAENTVTVRSGESFWSITRELLGPEASEAEVAAAWPYLWETNAHHVHDPDLLTPGTVLTIPEALTPRHHIH